MNETAFLIDLRRLRDLRSSAPRDAFSELNHQLLCRLGALDGVVPDSWSAEAWADPSLDDLREAGQTLLRTAETLSDPRLALTFPFWKALCGGGTWRLIAAPPVPLLGSVAASASLWEVYTLSALLALVTSETPSLEADDSPEAWSAAGCETDHQRELCGTLRRPWTPDDPRLDPGYLRAALSAAYVDLRRHQLERLARLAEFLGHKELVRGLAQQELEGLRADGAELSQQIVATRAAVEQAKGDLRDATREWLDVEDRGGLLDAVEKWKAAHGDLATSWSFRLGRTILRLPRAVYLRTREPNGNADGERGAGS